MKKMTLIWLIALCFTSCKKDKPSQPKPLVLPPETQTGKNTFGCLVNGEVWLPYVSFNFSGVYALQVGFSNGTFYVKGTKSTDPYGGTMVFGASHVKSTGSFDLKQVENYGNFATFLNGARNCEASTDSNNIGNLFLTRLDTINGIISGRFNFIVESNECGKLKITEGRFDLKL